MATYQSQRDETRHEGKPAHKQEERARPCFKPRLERLEEFAEMRRIDYQESWARVHYLMHASPDTRQALLSYVADLRDASHPPALADRVAAIQPGYPARFLGYVASLNSTGGAVIRAASAEL